MSLLPQIGGVAAYPPHEDLSPADEHRGIGHTEPLLQPLQIQLLHLFIAALHLHRVEGEHGQPLHVLRGERMEDDQGDGEQTGREVELVVQDLPPGPAEDTL